MLINVPSVNFSIHVWQWIDIDECKSPEKYPCYGICRNTEGNYDCFCGEGTKGNATIANCTKNQEKFPYPARVAIGKYSFFLFDLLKENEFNFSTA